MKAKITITCVHLKEGKANSQKKKYSLQNVIFTLKNKEHHKYTYEQIYKIFS